MTEWIRVKDTGTKHEFTVARESFVKDAMEELKNKDAVDEAGNPLPAKPHVTPKMAEQIKQSEKENH